MVTFKLVSIRRGTRDIYIYILYSCLSQLVIIHELLFVLFIRDQSFIYFVHRSIICFVFIPIDPLLIYCSKEKRATLILNRVQVFRSR
jgi:hypothetical protein